jgi:septin family protein
LDCDKIKKALIVVGKMGHGKSSFVNTLIRPKSGE